MRNLLARFQHLLDQLASHPDIVIRDGDAAIPPMHPRQRQYGLLALPDNGIALTPDVEDLFELTSHRGLWWQGTQDGNVVVAGEWKLWPLDLFSHADHIKKSFFRYSIHRDDPKVEQMFLIDDRPRSGSMEFAMAWRNPEKPGLPEELYYYDKGELWRMTLDYTSYVEEMIRFMGVNRWQIIFCEGVEFADSRWSHYFPKLQADLQQMQRLFPGDHWQAAIDRLAPLAEASAVRIRGQKNEFDLSAPGHTVADLMAQSLCEEDFCQMVLTCQNQGGPFLNDADFATRLTALRAQTGRPDNPHDPSYLRFRAQIYTFHDHVRLGTIRYSLTPPSRKLP